MSADAAEAKRLVKWLRSNAGPLMPNGMVCVYPSGLLRSADLIERLTAPAEDRA